MFYCLLPEDRLYANFLCPWALLFKHLGKIPQGSTQGNVCPESLSMHNNNASKLWRRKAQHPDDQFIFKNVSFTERSIG